MRKLLISCFASLMLIAVGTHAWAQAATSAPMELVEAPSPTPSSDQGITYSIVQRRSDQDTEIVSALIQSLAESFKQKGAVVGTAGAGKYDSEVGVWVMYDPEQQYETYTLYVSSALNGAEFASYNFPLTEAPKGLFCGSGCRREAILKNLLATLQSEGVVDKILAGTAERKQQLLAEEQEALRKKAEAEAAAAERAQRRAGASSGESLAVVDQTAPTSQKSSSGLGEAFSVFIYALFQWGWMIPVGYVMKRLIFPSRKTKPAKDVNCPKCLSGGAFKVVSQHDEPAAVYTRGSVFFRKGQSGGPMRVKVETGTHVARRTCETCGHQAITRSRYERSLGLQWFG